MRQRSKHNDRRLSVLIIAICTMITFPVMMIPVGLRESTPAGVLVGRAYAAAYPYNDQEDNQKYEDWAINFGGSESSDPTDETADPTADPSITPDGTEATVDPTDIIDPDEPDEPYMPIQTVDPETGRVLIEVGEGSVAVSESYIDERAQTEDNDTEVFYSRTGNSFSRNQAPRESGRGTKAQSDSKRNA